MYNIETEFRRHIIKVRFYFRANQRMGEDYLEECKARRCETNLRNAAPLLPRGQLSRSRAKLLLTVHKIKQRSDAINATTWYSASTLQEN